MPATSQDVHGRDRPGHDELLKAGPISVIAGLVPAISIRKARLCRLHRDGRDKPGHDV